MPIDPEALRTGGALQGGVAASLLRQRERASELMRGTTIGPYRVVRELGRGGMAIVYLAERADGEYEQQVALKWMQHAQANEAGAELFRRERQALADLRHPHIARLIDGGRGEDGRPWLAMDFVDGERLDRHCVRESLPLGERLALFLQVCAAVAHAHARGLIHRDIKPSNVLVERGGGARLLDFGIAQLLGQDDGLASGAFTPGFASPEQMRGEAVTVAGDVYQLGRLLASLACDDEEQQATLAAQPTLASADAAEPTPLPETLPRDLAAIVRKATANDPAARYATADALADDVRAFLERRPVRALPRRPAYIAARYLQRHPLGVTLGVLVLALLIGGGAWFTLRIAAERDVATRERAAAERERDAARDARASTDAINRFLDEDVLDAANPLRRAPGANEVTVREALDQAEARVDARFANDPPRAAAVLTTLGVLRYEFGEHEHAMALYDRALQAAASLSPTHDERLRVEAERAALLITMQRFDEAAAALDALLARAAPVLRADDPRLFEWRLRRIEANSRQGTDATMVPALRALRHDADAALGAPNAISGEAASMVAESLIFSGHPDQSLDDAHVAYEALAATLGPDHPSTLKALTAMGHGLRATGRDAEAIETMQRAYALQKARYGADSQDAMYMENELAFTLSAIGRQGEAEPLFVDLVERRARHRETMPAVYAQASGNLATTRMRLGRYAAALDDYQRAADALRDHPDAPASVRSNVQRGRGDALRELGRLDEADAAYAASAAAAEALPAGDVRRLLLDGARARLLLARGEGARGTAQLDQAIAALQASVPANHPGLVALREARAAVPTR